MNEKFYALLEYLEMIIIGKWFMERKRKMTENSYKTPCGCIHYFVNIIDKQKITLVFLPGLTADHRLFEKQTEYFEKKQNVFVWDAPSHALSRPFTNNYSLSDMAEWLYLH